MGIVGTLTRQQLQPADVAHSRHGRWHTPDRQQPTKPHQPHSAHKQQPFAQILTLT